ncbi:hypothetical protein [Legionella antarctica]|nr:hypothetical protein [Legionella antarctica]
MYWDDWVFVFQKPQTLKVMYAQSGYPWMAYVQLFLQKMGNSIYIYRILTFVTYFLSGIFLLYILQKTKLFNKSTALLLTLLFLLAPLDDARAALVSTASIVTFFLFFAAFFLLSLYLDNKKKHYYRALSLALFLISFSLESLLVFYATVLFYILWNIYQKNIGSTRGFQTQQLSMIKRITLLIKPFFIQYPDFICLPILFFILKHSFLQPYGLYANYNSIGFNFFQILDLILKSFLTSFYVPIVHALTTAVRLPILTIAVFYLVMHILKKMGVSSMLEKSNERSWREIKTVLIMGLVLFFLAVFPYCVVGKLPQNLSWDSRSQILIPLGMSFLIYYLVMMSAKINKRIPVLAVPLLISSFIVQALHTYYLYDLDWFYQQSLSEQFKQSKIIRENSTFIVQDNLEMDIWVNKRGLSFYEVNGLLKQALKDDSRLVVHDIHSINDFAQYKEYPQYNFSKWINKPPVYLAFSKNENYTFSWNKKFLLFFYSIFDRKAFEKNVAYLTEITSTPGRDGF